MKTEEVVKLLTPAAEKPKIAELLSSGSTLLNLACSGSPHGAFPKGSQILLVGDSSSGKTFLSLTCFAEAIQSKEFKDYRFIYDGVEGGAIMDWKKFFGKEVADRVEPPYRCPEYENDFCSSSVEDFYFHLDDAVKAGKPFIYVLDSMDALATDEETDKFQEVKKAKAKGKETTGSYGTSKAKLNSSGIRQVLAGLRDTGSILLVITQTRANIGFGAMYNPKTRGGGHALTFYSQLELWSSVDETVKKTVKGKPRQLGIISKIKVKKNRLTGKLREVEIPILWSYGIDDNRSMVRYLIEEGHWKEEKGIIDAKEFKFKGSEDKLVAKLEQEGLVKELKALVGDVWNEVEKACEQEREPRYA